MEIKDFNLGGEIDIYFYSLDIGTLEIKVETCKGYVSKFNLNKEHIMDHIVFTIKDENGNDDFTIPFEELDWVREDSGMLSLKNDKETLEKYKHILWSRAYDKKSNLRWKMSCLITEYNINKKIEEKFRTRELTPSEEEQKKKDLEFMELLTKNFSNKRR